MRNMSFMLTTEQIKNRTKTVTRRLGWRNLKPGTLLRACKKCMGLKKGEKVEELAVIRVIDVRREPLDCIHDESKCGRFVGPALEGFLGFTPGEFVEMFCRHMKCNEQTEVTRIEFEYVD